MTEIPVTRDMNEKIPIKLKKEPLIEVVWEIRFACAEPSVADLLPGVLFGALADKYPQVVRLPAADIPAPVAESDPRLKYIPKIRLEKGNQAVQIGEHAVSLNCRRPYSGWAAFSKEIRTLVEVIRSIKLIGRLERFSLRYVNLIDLGSPPRLSWLKLDLKMGDHEIDTRPIQLRTEIREGDLTHIIQIVSPAEASIPSESGTLRGLLLDVDSIRLIKENESWEHITANLEMVHLSAKRMVFGLLTQETINNLEPEYEEER